MNATRRSEAVVVAFMAATMYALIELPISDAYAQTEIREIIDEEGIRYVGETKDGIRHGMGRLEWPNGRVYEGDFRGDLLHGHGLMTNADGETYEGTFVQGDRHGFGILKFANGDIYEGSFRKGVISGEGRLDLLSEGARYTGSFRNGKMQGIGTYRWSDGSMFEGHFRDGEKYGFGVLQSADDSTYRGFFFNDKRHGDGVLTSLDGARSFQRWNGGNLISESAIKLVEHCKLRIDEQNWMFMSNQCINGLAHGEGTAVREDGEAYISHGVIVLGQLAQGVIVPLVNTN